MSWETIVLLLGFWWGACFLVLRALDKSKDHNDRLRNLEEHVRMQTKELDWVSAIVREKICK